MSSLYAFWFLNHRLDKKELRWQLEELKDKGFSGVFPHPRDGLLTPYMSAEWFDAIRFIGEECRRLGLEFWLYDEDPYPSGVAGGKVIYDHEEYSCRHLEFVEQDMVSEGRAVDVNLPSGCVLKVFALPKGKPEKYVDITDQCGVLRTSWHVMGCVTSGYYPPYTRMGRPHWRASTSNTFWQARCELPRGRYTIVAVFERLGANSKWGGYTDLMNPAATDYFIELTHERYKQELGSRLFSTVQGIFTDESKVHGTFPWTKGLPARFADDTGRDLLDLLPHLNHDLGAETNVIRHAYRRVVGSLFREGYTRRLFSWCEKNGIQSAGHLSPEEDPVGQQRMIPDLMNLVKDFQLPGTDLIASNIGTRDFCIINIGQKLVASVARQQGRREVLCEALGVSGEDLGPARMKSMLDWLFVLGVNKIVIHGQFYSLDGHRKREAPPSIFWQAPYWPYFNKVSEYIQSTASVLKRGQRHCEIAVLYPTAHIDAMTPTRSEEAEEYRQRLGELCFELLSNQFDLDFVSEDDLLECKIERSGFRVGRAMYRVLIVPEVLMLERSVCARVRRLASSQGRVVFLGGFPRVLEDGSEAKIGVRPIPSGRLLRHLDDRIARPLTVSGENEVFCMTRQIGKACRHFLFNASHADYVGEATVMNGRWLVDAGDGGKALPSSRSGKPSVAIPALGSLLLKEAKRRPNGEPPSKRRDVPLSEWRVRPLAENVLVLRNWRVGASEQNIRHCLDLPNDYVLPDAAQEAGTAWFETTFDVGRAPKHTKLVWDQASIVGAYEILVNGETVGGVRRERVYDACNLVADIARHLHPKRRNHIKVKVERQGEMPPRLIEPVRIYGDFAVASLGDDRRPLRITRAEWPVAVEQCGSWTDMGLPHYSGTVAYEATVELRDPLPRRAELRFERIAEVARVIVKGEDCGVVAWPPWLCDVSKALNVGTNQLVVEVANTSMNFIEGVRSESGLLGDVTLRLEE